VKHAAVLFLLLALNAVNAGDVDTFLKLCADKHAAASTSSQMVVPGMEGWLFFSGELRHLSAGKFWGEDAPKVSRAKPEFADPLPALLDFKEQLEKAGVELLFVPVPAKAAVYPEKLDPAAPSARIDIQHQEFLKLLKERGIAVLDLSEAFRAARADDAAKGPVYCQQDTHWSGRGCELAAQRIAEYLRARPWFKDLKKQTVESHSEKITLTGDLWRGAYEPGANGKPQLEPPATKETLPLRIVGVRTGGDLKPVEADERSPIALLGDSHCLVFSIGGDDMHAAGAGLPDQLLLETGVSVDLVAVRGSGATPSRLNFARKARADAAYLPSKKIVIYCLTVREFTEGSGWRKIPLLPQK